MEHLYVKNSSYYIIKRTGENGNLKYAEYYDRKGNPVGIINLLFEERNYDSTDRLNNFIERNSIGMAQIQKISFSHHIKLGTTINFIDKNNNIICYGKYKGIKTKNGIIEYYKKKKNNCLNNKIDFDYIKNNDIEINKYDPKLNVCSCILF